MALSFLRLIYGLMLNVSKEEMSVILYEIPDILYYLNLALSSDKCHTFGKNL